MLSEQQRKSLNKGDVIAIFTQRTSQGPYTVIKKTSTSITVERYDQFTRRFSIRTGKEMDVNCYRDSFLVALSAHQQREKEHDRRREEYHIWEAIRCAAADSSLTDIEYAITKLKELQATPI